MKSILLPTLLAVCMSKATCSLKTSKDCQSGIAAGCRVCCKQCLQQKFCYKSFSAAQDSLPPHEDSIVSHIRVVVITCGKML